MCKHCANLIEDKEAVHRFFEVAVARLNEILPKRIGKPLHRPVTADDIEPPAIKITAVFWHESPFRNTDTQRLVIRMFNEMDDSGYYLSQRERTITAEETERLRSEIEKMNKKES